MNVHFASLAPKVRVLCLVALILSIAFASTGVSLKAAILPTPVNCGDRIQMPGLYVLTQDLTCNSQTASRLPAVEIVASQVQFNLQGFTLRGAVSVSGASKVTIANGTVSIGGFSFELIGMSAITLSNVGDSKFEELTIHSGVINGIGLSISGGGNNLFRENHISGSIGVTVSGSAIADSFVRNSMSGTEFGLSVAETVRDAVFASNDIGGGGTWAAALIHGTNNLLEDCGIHGGLSVSGNNHNVRDNTVNAGFLVGLVIAGNGNVVQGNVVLRGSWYTGDGISVAGTDNVIRGNTATGAVPPGVDLSGSENTCTENKWRNNIFGTARPDCIR